MATIGLEATEENLFKFMFCLESAYSLFTRLILAKACEDYKLPYVEFSRFIKTEIENISFSYRGSIPLLAWAITTKNLIESMKQRLVKSVFEGDIFYWWEDSYKDISAGDALYSPKLGKPRAQFGEALAEIIFTLYKFDFSEIVGDPLGTLYQRYFDKETRKALGEFYTPLEVVTYILDAVGYEGRSVLNKRLLDPACGSGTFLVEALRRYLKASEQVAEEKGWSKILEELCNEYRIAGFDIHPFATFMAQMQFMLVLIPAYKRAMDEDRHFILSRLPIFRTDSLVDETKGETKKVTLETFEEGVQYILIDSGLPVEGGNLKIQMPYFKHVIANTDLPNVEEYFAALQAVFDTVKAAAWQERYKVTKTELERNFKRYLKDKDWNGLVSYFTPYAEHFLQKFKELKETFGDGKLIKSLEDVMLAAVLKNYVKYDFVVGNPPYVRVQMLDEKQRIQYRGDYECAVGLFDIYVLFMERGIKWLDKGGRIGFITSNKFIQADYGKNLRDLILKEIRIDQMIDFGDTGVFRDATNYPLVFSFTNNPTEENKFLFVKVMRPQEAILTHIKNNFRDKYQDDSILVFEVDQQQLDADLWKFMPSCEMDIIKKIENNSNIKVKDFARPHRCLYTGLNEAYVLDRDQIRSLNLENRLIRPVIGGENIKRWKITWEEKFIIYPYKIINDKFVKVNLNEYPNIKEHLNQFKSKLTKRWYIKKIHKDQREERWFEYADPRNPKQFENNKIITPDISTSNSFVLDYNKYFSLNTSYVIDIDRFEGNPVYLLGILNSKAIEFYYKHVSPFISGGYYRYISQFLEQIPIRLPRTQEEEKLADRIKNLVEQIVEQVELEQNIENFPEEYLKEFRNKGEEFISLFISFNSNHKTLEPVITENIDGRGYNVVISKKETHVFVDSKLKADYVVAALKGKRAKKDEKLQLLVPKSDAVVEAILTELEDDKARTKLPSVTELEDGINELVYKLYGLDEDDINVIEEFLRRF